MGLPVEVRRRVGELEPCVVAHQQVAGVDPPRLDIKAVGVDLDAPLLEQVLLLARLLVEDLSAAELLGKATSLLEALLGVGFRDGREVFHGVEVVPDGVGQACHLAQRRDQVDCLLHFVLPTPDGGLDQGLVGIDVDFVSLLVVLCVGHGFAFLVGEGTRWPHVDVHAFDLVELFVVGRHHNLFYQALRVPEGV